MNKKLGMLIDRTTYSFAISGNSRVIPTITETKGGRIYACSTLCDTSWIYYRVSRKCKDHITTTQCNSCRNLLCEFSSEMVFESDSPKKPFWIIRIGCDGRLVEVTSCLYVRMRHEVKRLGTLRNNHITEAEFRTFRAQVRK